MLPRSFFICLSWQQFLLFLSHSCTNKWPINILCTWYHLFLGGLISAPPIPVGFWSFLWIPVGFWQNLPAKISGSGPCFSKITYMVNACNYSEGMYSTVVYCAFFWFPLMDNLGSIPAIDIFFYFRDNSETWQIAMKICEICPLPICYRRMGACTHNDDTRCTGMNVKVWNTQNKDQVPQEKP